jgi:4-amino-4-deoxy-L-arabinose transferase-like glycosyltransferase
MTGQRESRRTWLWWLIPLAATAGALALRALLASPTRVVWGDEPFYLWDARNLALGRGYTFFNGVPDVYLTPLYPLLIAGLYLLLHNLELASRLCYIVLGAALTLPIYAIAGDMYGRRSAIVAAVLLAAYPALTAAQLYWGTLTEPLYFLLAYAGLYAALRALRDGGWPAHIAAGALFALAYLTRGEGVAYIVAVGGALVLVRLAERRLWRRDVWPRLLAMAGAFVLVALPYWIYLRAQTGQWMISGQAGMTYITCISLAYGDAAGFDRATWGLDQAGREVVFFSPDIVQFSMLDHIRANPGQFAGLVYTNIRDFVSTLFAPRMFPWYLLPFLALGLFDFAWDRRRAKGELVLLASMAPALGFVFFFVQERYIGAVLPLLVIWTAHGVERWGGWLADTLTRLLDGRLLAPAWRSIFIGALTALLLSAFVVSLPRVAAGTSVGSFRPAHRQAGLWLAAHGAAGQTVMSRYPAIPFHAGADWVPTPNASPAQVVAYARLHGARYFVLDERETITMRPQLAALVEAPQTPGLRRLHEIQDAGERIVIFEVEP